jgi:hypothetical protein
MENPLISSTPPEENKPAETPGASNASSMEGAPATEAGQKPAPTAAPKAKKPFFTIGKIIAFFGILVVIAAIVGAIIYSQTSERFQGTVTHVSVPAPEGITGSATTGYTGVTSEFITLIPTCSDDQGLTLNSAGDSCVCDVSENFVPTTQPITATVYVAPCICKKGTLFNPGNNTCEEVNYCDLTEVEIQSAINDSFNVNTRTELEAILADYASCVDPTCNDHINDFKTAYANKQWVKYEDALNEMIAMGCISNCKAKLYWEIYYLWIGDIAEAKQIAAQNETECPGCDNQFNFLALVAQVISDIDQEKQQIGEVLDPDYIESLKGFATEYIGTCQCVELEAFIDNPSFDIQALFPESIISLSVEEFIVLNKSTTNVTGASGSPLTYLNDDEVLTIAYAQSASLSPAVISALEEAYNTNPLCVPPEPVNCSALEITLPSTDDMEITEDFVATTDLVKFAVTGTDDVEHYHVYASNDTLTFDDLTSDEYTENTQMTLSGGPVVDEPVTITVQAIDIAGLPLENCKDGITITRTPTPSDPICRDLNIVIE